MAVYIRGTYVEHWKERKRTFSRAEKPWVVLLDPDLSKSLKVGQNRIYSRHRDIFFSLRSSLFLSLSLFLCSTCARTHIIDSVGVRYKMSIRLFGERNIRRGVVDIDFFVPSFQENVLSQECNWSGHYETRLLTCTTEFQMDRRKRNNGKGVASISSLREWRLVGRIQIECDSEIYATVPLCLELKNG